MDDLHAPWKENGDETRIENARGEAIFDLTSSTTPAQLALALAAPRLREENERLKRALAFYADPCHWNLCTVARQGEFVTPTEADAGELARAALGRR